MHRSKLLLKFLRTVFGLFVFGLGSYLALKANIGLAPWETLSMGLSLHLPLSFGATHVAVSLVVILFDLLLREPVGYGTLLNAFLVGSAVDLFAAFDPTPAPAPLAVSVALLVAGLFIMGLGQYFYMSAGLSCGPRDALMVALGRRFPRLPIGAVNAGISVLVLAAGWLLGALVGVGTIIAGLGTSAAMQAVFSLLRFEPRDVAHLGLVETTRLLFGRRTDGAQLPSAEEKP